MATNKQYLELEKIAVEQLIEFSPTITDCNIMSHGKKYTIQTPRAGEVVFMIDRDDLENKRGQPATISFFVRFDNEKAARALGFDCNQFSGKWNHHFLFSRGQIVAVFDELREKAF